MKTVPAGGLLPEDSFHRTNGQSAVLPSFKSTIKEFFDCSW
jgi:hypothetical protein